jgi:hypothetical protein
MSRTFSRRYVSTLAPDSLPPEVKRMSMNFPNRDELSLRDVLAFPKLSRMGLLWSTCCSMQAWGSTPPPAEGGASWSLSDFRLLSMAR